MASKRIFQVIFAALGAFCSYRSVAALQNAKQRSIFPAGDIRLRILGLRGGGNVSESCSIFKTGLLWNSCDLSSANTDASQVDSCDNIIFRKPNQSNGYFLVIDGSENGAADPARWILEVSNANGNRSEWQTIGASVWRFTPSGDKQLFPNLNYATPHLQPPAHYSSEEQGLTGNGVKVKIDGRPPLSWYFSAVADPIPYALGFVSFAIAGFAKHPSLMSLLWATTLASDVTITVAGGIAVAAVEPWMWRQGILQMVNAVFELLLLVGSLRWERQIIRLLLSYCIGILISTVTAEVILYEVPLSRAVNGQLLGLNFIAAIFAVCVLAFRRVSLSRARRLILADQLCYDALWKTVQGNPSSTAALQLVNEEVLLIAMENSGSMWEATPRQRTLVAVAASRRRSISPERGRRGSIVQALEEAKGMLLFKKGEPVISLDQLFVQVWNGQILNLG